jgi:hypothetical protein
VLDGACGSIAEQQTEKESRTCGGPNVFPSMAADIQFVVHPIPDLFSEFVDRLVNTEPLLGSFHF